MAFAMLMDAEPGDKETTRYSLDKLYLRIGDKHGLDWYEMFFKTVEHALCELQELHKLN